MSEVTIDKDLENVFGGYVINDDALASAPNITVTTNGDSEYIYDQNASYIE